MPLELEYRAARNDAGLLDLSARGKIEVTGPDRVSFLHNILSQDIKTLPAGGHRPAALLSAPAKVLAWMNVWKLEDKILLDTDPGFEEKLLGLLAKFIITEEVVLRKATQEYAHFQIKGSEAEAVFSFCHFEAGGLEISGISPPRQNTASRRNDITIIARNGDSDKIYASFTQAGAVPIGPEAAEILRIEEGILHYGVDVTEEVSLPETGLDETYASETKGCYPGQEVVARTKTYKGLQRKMTGLIFESREGKMAGSKIYSGEKEIGWITSACISPALGGIALGYLTKGFFSAESGEKTVPVEIRTASGNIPAKTRALPFYRLSG